MCNLRKKEKNMKKIVYLSLSLSIISFSLKADMVTKITTIRKMDAITRQFLAKISEIRKSAGVLKGRFKCMKKNRDQAKCVKRGCADVNACLLAIFNEFEMIMAPIMQNLVGTYDIGSGKLKPGVLTALPQLWDDPKPDSITKMQNILLQDIALPLNEIYSFIKLLRDSLDPSIKPENKPVPVTVDETKVDSMNLDQAPLPADADENATQPTEAEIAKVAAAAVTESQAETATPATAPVTDTSAAAVATDANVVPAAASSATDVSATPESATSAESMPST